MTLPNPSNDRLVVAEGVPASRECELCGRRFRPSNWNRTEARFCGPRCRKVHWLVRTGRMPENCKERYLERILRRATALKSRRYRARRKADGRIVRVLRPAEWRMVLEFRAREAEVRGHAGDPRNELVNARAEREARKVRRQVLAGVGA